MGFGTKKPLIKTKRESFADALATYREEQAALQASITSDKEVAEALRTELLAIELEVSNAKMRRDDLRSQIGIAQNDLMSKQNAHLLWVGGVLAKETLKLNVLIKSAEEKEEEFAAEKEKMIASRAVADTELAAARGDREMLKRKQAELEVERVKERSDAAEDRRRLDEVVNKYADLVRVLEAREITTRPVPRPITLKKGARK